MRLSQVVHIVLDPRQNDETTEGCAECAVAAAGPSGVSQVTDRPNRRHGECLPRYGSPKHLPQNQLLFRSFLRIPRPLRVAHVSAPLPTNLLAVRNST